MEPVPRGAGLKFGVEALDPPFGQKLHPLAELAGVEVAVLPLRRQFEAAPEVSDVGHVLGGIRRIEQAEIDQDLAAEQVECRQAPAR